MSAKNVTVTVASVVVAEAGYIKWIQGTGTTYTVAVNAQTDYITVTDTTNIGTVVFTDMKTDVTFAKAGVLATATGAFRWYNDLGRTLTFVSARASVTTAPTGASIKCDVNVDGTTCFVSSSQANRPTIAISGFTNKTTTFDSITTIADGSYLTVDIDQIGSTIAGSDLTVTIVMQG